MLDESGELNEDFDSCIDSSNKKLVLIVYDIVNDKRRRRMVKHLESFGNRVQKSAFECLTDDGMFKKLVEKLPDLIDEKEDLLRIYRLSQHCKMQFWGSVEKLKDSDYWVI